MERWSGRVAMVTGASAGIGAAIAQQLVNKGLKVVGLARRVDKMKEMATKLKNAPGELHAIQCDVTKEQDILEAFSWVKKNLGGVDVMVNNAGVVHQAFLSDGETAEWRHMIDVNVMALSICTREAVKSMKERGVTDGHLIHINSISGHRLPHSTVLNYFYGATKHAVTALAEGLRRELVKSNSKTRVTSISPGLVRTEIMEVAKMRTTSSSDVFSQNPCLEPEDIANAVLYVLGAPAHVQVHELTIIPNGQKY